MASFNRGIFSLRNPAAKRGPIHATGAQTDGAVGIFEGVIPPG